MKKHYRHENNCLNCGTTLDGKFCHNCGQENLEIKESFGHMMDHAVSDYFHFDHQFFQTLKPLFLKPGMLTNEYMAGRRVHYLHPVKMYIFISVVYFLVLFQSGHQIVQINNSEGKPVKTEKILDSVNKEIANNKDISARQKKLLEEKVKKYGALNINVADPDEKNKKHITGLGTATSDTSLKQYQENQKKLLSKDRDGFLKRIFNEKMLSYNEKYGSRAQEVFLDELKHNTPKMMFILLPLFAVILRITFWSSKKYYVEHLIYALHLHCFLFLFLAIVMLIQSFIPINLIWIFELIGFFSTVYITWYIYRSLRVVYHRNRFRTITKMLGMGVMYFVAFFFSIMIVLVVTALTIA
ncbi:MAG TPA: DUF3667 domain-containing protein [Mucilaginibacter sp.]|jgi:hypothetical protein